MAAGTSLVIVYATSDGSKTTHTWRYAKPAVTKNQVQSLITATISAGSIFTKEPQSVQSAKIVTTTETEFDLDEVMQANGRDMRHLISVPVEDEEDDEDGEKVEKTENIPKEEIEIARLKARIAELEGK